jgi:regulator of protease activity HflC (stomatin/prohibitin superfamily)
LGNPDQMQKNDQEDESLQVFESRVVLPQIRTIFRNVAETMNALQFVNSRSQVESQASTKMKEELLKLKVTSEGVFIGNIDLDSSEAGKALILTQTEREVAVNQQKTFAEKQTAEEARARFVLAQEEADQQRKLAAAKYQVLVREQEAKAREVEAQGEARYITITSDAKKAAYAGLAQAIGAEGVVQIELLKAVADGKVDITPQVMVTGGGSALDALAGTLLGNTVKPAEKR